MRGKYVRKLVDNYCVLDLETTGLSFEWSEIIEVGIIKVRNNEIVDEYNTLVKPDNEIDEFIENLTGITNEMVQNSPKFKDICNDIFSFIGNDLIVGHNTSFDLNFLYFSSKRDFENEYIDTLQFCRKLFPELKNHRLSDMTSYLGLTNNNHRSLDDCISTYELYSYIKNRIKENNTLIDDLFCNHSNKLNFKSLTPQDVEPDTESIFYQKHCCFTGTLERMVRKDAAQIIVNIGGYADDNVTKETNFLIIGNYDYCSNLKNGKSSKFKKAEKLKLKGNDIEIIDENTFYELIKE